VRWPESRLGAGGLLTSEHTPFDVLALLVLMRDIRLMLESLEIGVLSFEASYLSEQNKVLPMFKLPKDLTLTLVSGYDAGMRLRLAIHWLSKDKSVELVMVTG
jgi:hypothetical protein